MTKTIAIEEAVPFLGADWFDPLETGVRQQIRSFIEGMLEEELAAALGRGRYDRFPGASGYRNGHRDRNVRPCTAPRTGDGYAVISQCAWTKNSVRSLPPRHPV